MWLFLEQEEPECPVAPLTVNQSERLKTGRFHQSQPFPSREKSAAGLVQVLMIQNQRGTEIDAVLWTARPLQEGPVPGHPRWFWLYLSSCPPPSAAAGFSLAPPGA